MISEMLDNWLFQEEEQYWGSYADQCHDKNI